MKTFHQICEQYRRLDTENYRLLSIARRKGIEPLRAHYANRSRFIRDRFMATLHRWGEQCRAAGMRWDADIEEYV